VIAGCSYQFDHHVDHHDVPPHQRAPDQDRGLGLVRRAMVPVMTLPALAVESVSTPGVRVLRSARVLPGRRFEPVAEAQLAIHIECLVASLPAAQRRGVLLISEVAGPFGIPDFVALVPDPDRLPARLDARFPPLLSEAATAIAVAVSARRRTSTEAVAVRVGLPRRVVRERLAALRQVGAVFGDDQSGWLRHEALAPIGRTHVFEAKVSDWRKGFSQAVTYAAWGDSATVVLARAPETWRQSGTSDWIGLAIGPKWRRRPVVRRHSPARRLWASEHIVAALTAYHPSARA
jgi:hypothetical protein